jgi:hypothetical protein
MVRNISYSLSPLIQYLTVNGKYLTPNTTVFPSSVITGPLGTNTLTDWRSTPGIREIAINLTVQEGAGSLSVSLLILDPIESSNGISSQGNPPLATLPIVSNSAPISGSAVVRFTITRSGDATAWVNNTPTSLGSFQVPFKWQILLNVSGNFSIIGTYEGRD